MGKIRVVVTGGSGFIGIHLVERLRMLNYEVLNLDIRRPIDGKYLDSFQCVSILDDKSLHSILTNFMPNHIVHLAAVTTQNAQSLEDFDVNIRGTRNLIQIANILPTLQSFVFTSSQYVSTPGEPISESLDELKPYGFYGESKLIGEKMIQKELKTRNWTIIRPALIWGPFHPVLVNGLWHQIFHGRYVHPRIDKAIKGYGFVYNTAWQIEKIISLPKQVTAGKTLYLADTNSRQDYWVNLFSEHLAGKSVRKLPRYILFFIAEIGQLLLKFGIDFPLYRSRFKNLVTSNPVPLTATHQILGRVPIDMPEGVSITTAWYLSRGV